MVLSVCLLNPAPLLDGEVGHCCGWAGARARDIGDSEPRASVVAPFP